MRVVGELGATDHPHGSGVVVGSAGAAHLVADVITGEWHAVPGGHDLL